MRAVYILVIGLPLFVALMVHKYFRDLEPKTKVNIAIVTTVVCLLIYLSTPSRTELDAITYRIFRADPASVTLITVAPLYSRDDPRRIANLVSAPLRIDDKQEIKKLLGALKNARDFNPNHGGPEWAALISFQDEQGVLTFKLYKDKSPKNGTYLWMSFPGLASLYARCDELSDVVEEIVEHRNQ